MESQNKIKNVFSNEEFETRFFKLSQQTNLDNSLLRWDSELVSKELYNLIHNTKIINCIKKILGSAIMHNGDFHLRPKLPNNKFTIFPWHQDSQFYGEFTKYLHIITIHIPLVETNIKNGCLNIIKGSHKWGYIPRKEKTNQIIESEMNVEKKGNIFKVEMSIGDILIFHNLLFHSSNINKTSKIRWTLDLRYSRILPKKNHENKIQQAQDWFMNKMNSGWGPMIISGSKNITSYDDWILKRNNDKLPGRAGRVG